MNIQSQTSPSRTNAGPAPILEPILESEIPSESAASVVSTTLNRAALAAHQSNQDPSTTVHALRTIKSALGTVLRDSIRRHPVQVAVSVVGLSLVFATLRKERARRYR